MLKFFSARTQLTIGLILLVVTVMLAAQALGLVPDRQQAVREGRARLCESVTLQASAMISRKQQDMLDVMLQAVVNRNPDFLSAAIRRSDGSIVIEAGSHGAQWKPMNGEYSTDDQIQVPLDLASERWGMAEFRFRPLRAEGPLRFFQDPWTRFILFVTVISFFLFRIYLSKMLQQLDPSKAIPGRVKEALDTLAEGLVVLDRKERIVLANKAFASLVRQTPQTLMGHSLNELPWNSGDAAGRPARLPWTRVLLEHEPQLDQRITIEQEPGVVRTFQTNCSPVPGHDGNYRGVLVSFDDITLLEEQKLELIQSKKSADEANRTKSTFLANMSHEIRTPLNAILGFTEVLRRGLVEDESQQQQHLETIHRSSHFLLELINDILDLSKVEAGRLEIEAEPCAAHAVCLEVISVLQARAQTKGIGLRYEVPAPIPETVHTDVTRLRQILINLLGNAIKFTTEGEVRLLVRYEKAANQLAFEVIDTGVGMSPEALGRIFQPFVQADATVTRRFGGTGLGLAISKRFAEAMGGILDVRSQLGQGSTFRLLLPAGSLEGVRFIEAPSGEAATPSFRSSAPRGVRSLPPSRVLVVDDGLENRQLMRLVLTKAGVTVDEAENGQQALDRVSSKPYDLILMDMQMPVLDGYEATRRLRAQGFYPPIVALTANAMQDDEARCRAAGCSDFLAKPIDFDALLGLLADRLPPASTSPVPISPPVESEPAASLPGITPAAASRHAESGLIKHLQEQLHAVCEAYFCGDLARVSELGMSLQKMLSSQHPGELSADANKLKECADGRDADGVEQAIADLSIRLQELQSQAARESDTCFAQAAGSVSDAVTRYPANDVLSFRSSPAASHEVDASDFLEIAAGFVKRLQHQLAEMQLAWERQDYARLAFLAHWLKGAGGTMGFHEFTQPARQLEDLARREDRPGIRSVLAKLQELADAICFRWVRKGFLERSEHFCELSLWELFHASAVALLGEKSQ